VRLGQTFDKLSTCMNESTRGQEENNTDVLPSEASAPLEQRRALFVAYEGPLPPAQELIRYNQAHPEAAHRIITMAESQEAHRQKLETFGLIFGFVIVIMVTGAGTLLIFNNKPGTGLVIALSGIATLVWPFVVSQRTKEERTQNSRK
jgi:Predicted membrane protein (DUF2335)